MLTALRVVLLKIKSSKMKNQMKNYTNQLLENLKKKKVCLSFKYNTWGADLVDMQLFSKFNKEIRFLLCVIYIYSNYA